MEMASQQLGTLGQRISSYFTANHHNYQLKLKIRHWNQTSLTVD